MLTSYVRGQGWTAHRYPANGQPGATPDVSLCGVEVLSTIVAEERCISEGYVFCPQCEAMSRVRDQQ